VGEEAVKQKPAKQYSFTVRYGVRVIDAGGITSIPSILYRYGSALGLSPQDRDFIGHCLSYKWTSDDPWPAMRTIADRMGVSLRTVNRIAKHLVDKGYLEREARVGTYGKEPSILNFSGLWDALVQIATVKEPHVAEEDRITVNKQATVSACGMRYVTGDTRDMSRVTHHETEAVHESETNTIMRVEDTDNDSRKENVVELSPAQNERHDTLIRWMNTLGMASPIVERMLKTYSLSHLEEKRTIYQELLHHQYQENGIHNPAGFYYYLVVRDVQHGPPIAGPREHHDPIWHLFDEPTTACRGGDPRRLGEVVSRNGGGTHAANSSGRQ
jgi:DNA-binding transcriptional regulator YhcF (GntR family)